MRQTARVIRVSFPERVGDSVVSDFGRLTEGPNGADGTATGADGSVHTAARVGWQKPHRECGHCASDPGVWRRRRGGGYAKTTPSHRLDPPWYSPCRLWSAATHPSTAPSCTAIMTRCQSGGSRSCSNRVGQLRSSCSGLRCSFFPDGHLPTPRWRWALRIYCLSGGLFGCSERAQYAAGAIAVGHIQIAGQKRRHPVARHTTTGSKFVWEIPATSSLRCCLWFCLPGCAHPDLRISPVNRRASAAG